MWKIVTSSNLNPLLKLFFYSPILTNNNMLLKIYCENIIVTFLKYDILFFILFLFSLFSFHPYVIFFSLRYLLHTHCISIPPPSFPFSPSFKSPALLPSSVKKFSSTLSFFLQFAFSGFFFLPHIVLISLSPFLYLLCLLHAQLSFSSALSLCFFFYFFNLIPEGIMDKVFFISFPLKLFLPIWGDEICGPGKENFLPGFPLSLFSSLSQTVENTIFHSVFCSMFSIPSKITPTKHSVKENKYAIISLHNM